MNNEDIRYLSVSALNKYLYYKFDNDLNLRSVYLKAEVSNVRFSKGILYFVLKDNDSEINAIMFSQLLEKLNFKIEDGMTVLVNGKVSVYPKRGTYSITINQIEAVGLGQAYLEFLALKDKLMKEGLFDDKYKKEIPLFNHKIGLITSGTGDAMHDVISTVNRRYPLAEVILYPAIVQGKEAPLSLINAINKANEEAICDCLIICRGGGTIEDLSCFNDEELARCIFDSAIPTISGVGHEQDFTICDFVASRRAPTPTGAAVIACPDMNDLIKMIESKAFSLKNSIKNTLTNAYNKYNLLSKSYAFIALPNLIDRHFDKVLSIEKRLESLKPINKIENHLNLLFKDFDNINRIYENKLNSLQFALKTKIDKLIILNPLNIMSKGYSITYQDDKLISDISMIDVNKSLETKVIGGKIISEIKEVKIEKEEKINE